MPTGSAAYKAAILKAVPGGQAYEVVYPASFVSILSNGPSVAADDMIKHMQGRLKDCPNIKFQVVRVASA